MANIVPHRNQGQRGAMATRRRDPFGQLQDVMDELFDRMTSHWAGPFSPMGWTGGRQSRPMNWWDIDVTEQENELVVRAELPGFEPDEINLQMNGNILTIQAEKRKEGQREEDYRSFYEAVTLPPGIDPNKVNATYRNGLLELHMPRSEESRPRRIPIGEEQKTLSSQGHAPAGQSQAGQSQAGHPQAAATQKQPQTSSAQTQSQPAAAPSTSQKGKSNP